MPPRYVMMRQNDPNYYLWVNGEWYYYLPAQSSLLGEGAMGAVFKGYKAKDGTPVAIKRVHDKFCNNSMIRERARVEANLAFRHHNMVEMIGCCEYDPVNARGPIFLISKFVQGQNIDDYAKKLEDGPGKVEKISNAICSVLDALELVHSHNVLHRDIKPSNIMVEQGSNVRLMDLGIARMDGGNQFSQYGFVGTPEYAAPEQITGNSSDDVELNFTTDIYALGITFYELLTGFNPMAEETQSATLENQMKKELPSSQNIPPRLMSVIQKATAKNQKDRYQTAKEFREAIRAALIEPPSKMERFVEWSNRHYLIILLTCVLLLAGIVTLILTLR